MNTVIMVDGGAGRVIASIPALEHYVKSHPDENIKIFVYGWDSLLWSNKLLQPLSFNSNDKGTFNNHIKSADVVISPEPYRLPAYFNQKVSLSEAFDIIINGKNNNLGYPKLYLSQSERLSAQRMIFDIKNNNNKSKLVVIQPFGSTAKYENIAGNDYIIDDSARSMNLMMYSTLIKELSTDCAFVLFADQKFHFKEDKFTYKLNGDLRTYAALISQCDYFIGCDSVGQHMARAFDKPGTVVFGSTFPESVSYPDWFQIIDKNKETRTYSPLRMIDTDSHLADRMNEDAMDYSEKEINNITSLIRQHIKSI